MQRLSDVKDLWGRRLVDAQEADRLVTSKAGPGGESQAHVSRSDSSLKVLYEFATFGAHRVDLPS
jgi:hypothetical protein